MKQITSSKTLYSKQWRFGRQLTEKQKNIVRDLNQKLLSTDLQLEDCKCLCNANKDYVIAKKDRYRINQTTVICSNCGLIRSNPRMTQSSYEWFYSSDLYRKLYSPHLLKNLESDYEKMVNGYLPKYEIIKKFVDKTHTVLEVGCGAGWNLFKLKQDGINVVGYDYSPNLVNFGRKKELNLKIGGLEDIDEKNINFIILSHVLEHFLNPVDAFKIMRSILDDDGFLYVEVPNMDKFGLGSLQNAHTYYFTKNTLFYYAYLAGFESIYVTTKRLPGNHIGCIMKKKQPTIIKELITDEFKRIYKIIKFYDRKQHIKYILLKLGVFNILNRIRSNF